MSKRTFSASIDNINFSGKFTGYTPSNAAKKFINTLECNKKYNVYLKDGDKIYKYEGQKKKLDEPQTINISGGNSITFNYKNTVSRIF